MVEIRKYIKLVAPIALAASLISCGKSDNAPLESRVIQSDKTLSLARKQIDAEEYSSTIKLLDGYSTNDSSVLAERSFLLGEATIKSLNNERFRDLCHFVRIRGVPPQLGSEVGPTKTEILKLYREASSYFDSAKGLNKDFETRMGGICLVYNKKVAKTSENDSKSISLLKRLYFGLKENNESAILEAADVNYLRKLRLEKAEENYKEDMRLRSLERESSLEKERKFAALVLNDPEKDPEIRDTAKGSLKEIEKLIESRKNRAKRELADYIRSERAKIEGLSTYELVKKAENEYGIYWMNDNDAIIILKTDDSSAKLLTIDLDKKYNYPFLQLREINVSKKTGKLESFGNNMVDARYR